MKTKVYVYTGLVDADIFKLDLQAYKALRLLATRTKAGILERCIVYNSDGIQVVTMGSYVHLQELTDKSFQELLKRGYIIGIVMDSSLVRQ